MPETPGTDPDSGISGMGTKLAGAVTGAIGMATKITLPGLDSDAYDVTTMNAPAKWKKFIAGLRDAKQITVDMLYSPINMAAVLANFSGPNEVWTITFPDASTFTCSGFIKTLGTPIPYNDKITQSMTIQLSGKPTFSAGGTGSGVP